MPRPTSRLSGPYLVVVLHLLACAPGAAGDSVHEVDFSQASRDALVRTEPLEPRHARPRIPEGVLDGSAWLEHLEADILPFWTTEPARGVPVGNFPTFRCD